MQEPSIITFNQKNVYCAKSPKGYGRAYFAKHDFKPGEIVMRGLGKIINHQTNHLSIQIGLNKHYLPKKWTGRFWNHSCNPNCFVRTRTDGFPDWIAKRPIKKGRELTFAFSMTEFNWSPNTAENSAACLCGYKKCVGKIMSFSQLLMAHRSCLKKKKHIASFLHDT